jgi:glycine C-acetyltransferase
MIAFVASDYLGLLQKNNIFATGIVYPAVKIKEAQLRVSRLSSHETEHLDRQISKLKLTTL